MKYICQAGAVRCPGDTIHFMGFGYEIFIERLIELAVASADSRLHKLSQVLDISLLPLLVAFTLVMIFKVMVVLG